MDQLNRKNLRNCGASLLFLFLLVGCASDRNIIFKTSNDSVIAKQDLEFVGRFSYPVTIKDYDQDDLESYDDFYMQALRKAQTEFGEDVDIVDLNVTVVQKQNEQLSLFAGPVISHVDQYILVSGRVVRMMSK